MLRSLVGPLSASTAWPAAAAPAVRGGRAGLRGSTPSNQTGSSTRRPTRTRSRRGSRTATSGTSAFRLGLPAGWQTPSGTTTRRWRRPINLASSMPRPLGTHRAAGRTGCGFSTSGCCRSRKRRLTSTAWRFGSAAAGSRRSRSFHRAGITQESVTLGSLVGRLTKSNRPRCRRLLFSPFWRRPGTQVAAKV